ASNFGAVRSSPIRSAGSWPRRAGIKRRSSWPTVIPGFRRRPGATGPSSATAASTPTRRSPVDSSTAISAIGPELPRRDPFSRTPWFTNHLDTSMTPARLGYRMPAEWEPHEATWIAWPHNRDDWPGKFAPIPWVYAEIVRLLSAHEDVVIVVADRPMKRK